MNRHTVLSILLVGLVATGWIAPTIAAASTGDVRAQQEDVPEWDVIVQDDADEEQVLFAEPSPGPNGDFATVVEGEDGAGTLELELAEIESRSDGINPGTRSDFSDVFRVENRFDGEQTVSIVITSDDPNADLEELRDVVGFYVGGDTTDTIDGDGSVSVAPGESVPIGLTIDLTAADLAGESFNFAFEFVVVDSDEGAATTADGGSDGIEGDRGGDSADGGNSADGSDSADGGESDGSADSTPTSTATSGDTPTSSDSTPATDPDESPAGPDTPNATEAPSNDDGSSGMESGIVGPFAFVTAAVVLVSALSTLLAWRNGTGR
jgi:hypothetical protein